MNRKGNTPAAILGPTPGQSAATVSRPITTQKVRTEATMGTEEAEWETDDVSWMESRTKRIAVWAESEMNGLDGWFESEMSGLNQTNWFYKGRRRPNSEAWRHLFYRFQ